MAAEERKSSPFLILSADQSAIAVRVPVGENKISDSRAI
jgi:hypothetical protein